MNPLSKIAEVRQALQNMEDTLAEIDLFLTSAAEKLNISSRYQKDIDNMHETLFIVSQKLKMVGDIFFTSSIQAGSIVITSSHKTDNKEQNFVSEETLSDIIESVNALGICIINMANSIACQTGAMKSIFRLTASLKDSK